MRLSQRCKKSKKFVKTDIDNIVCVSKRNPYKNQQNIFHVFGGWEVVSDARRFPYNWRTYLRHHRKTIWKKNYIVVGGIGTKKKIGTDILYKIFLWRARRVVVREKNSYDIAVWYSIHTEQYHDFCYDLLEQVNKKDLLKKDEKHEYTLVNINKYLRNQSVIDICRQTVKKHSNDIYYFLPAAWWSDEGMFSKVKEYIPHVKIWDWRGKSVEEIIVFIYRARSVVAARLHILLVTKRLGVSFTPIVYQEKIKKIILEDN